MKKAHNNITTKIKMKNLIKKNINMYDNVT